MSEIHEHLTERVNRARVKLEIRRSAGPARVFAVGVLLAIAGLGYILHHVATTSFRNTNELRFVVNDAHGVVAGRADLRVKGIRAGTITKVTADRGHPVLTVKLDSGFGTIYRDARAQLRPNTALQDMYLDIVDRGTARAGVADARHPLPASQTSTSVNVADVLQVFDAPVRARLATMLDELGGGLNDRGNALRTAFVQLVPALASARRIASQLSANASQTRRLITNTATLTAELARRDRDLRSLVSNGGRTLRTLGDGSGDIDRILAQLPATLRDVDTSFASVDAAVPGLNRAITALDPVARQLPSALHAASDLARDATPAVRELRAPVKRLVPLAQILRPLSADLDSAARSLQPQAKVIDHATRSVAGCDVAIQRFFQWTPSVFKLGDQRGPSPRADTVVDITSAGPLSEPREVPYRSCAPGSIVGGRPGPGGTLQPDPPRQEGGDR